MTSRLPPIGWSSLSLGQPRLIWIRLACSCQQLASCGRQAPDRALAPWSVRDDDGVLDPEGGEGGAALGELGWRLVGRESRADRLLDFLVRAADRVAVPGQHIELVPDRPPLVGDVEQVAGVGVLRDQAKRLAFAHAADQDRRVRLCEWWRVVDRAPEAIVAPHEGRAVVAPHLDRELKDLLEPLEALADWRKRQVHRARLVLVVAGADSEPGAAAG